MFTAVICGSGGSAGSWCATYGGFASQEAAIGWLRKERDKADRLSQFSATFGGACVRVSQTGEEVWGTWDIDF